MTPPQGSDSLKGGPQTGEGYIDDRPSGCSRQCFVPAARPGRPDHRQPDRVPIDFGSTAVTGIHVSCVAALRDHYGLEKRPVKVHEPYQMLGLIDEDLKQALGDRRRGRLPPQDDVRLREQGLEALELQRPRRARARHVQHHRRRQAATP